MGFTGDASTGTPGDISETYRNQTVLRMNIFRRMAGLQPVTANPEYNRLCQAAAVLMSANGKISHNPDPTWKFFTQDGLRGAQNSSLALTYNGPSAIYAYVLDYGRENSGVEHRSSLLEPGLRVVGTGDVPSNGTNAAANAQGDGFDSRQYERNPEFSPPYLIWPPSGYVPHFLIPGRWSIRVRDWLQPAITFADARISLSRNGTPLQSDAPGAPNGGGSVWTLDGSAEGAHLAWTDVDGEAIFGPSTNGVDTLYRVRIENVRLLSDGSLYNGSGRIEYDVIGYDPLTSTSRPTFAIQPSSLSTVPGGTATFTVKADGVIAYQWFKGVDRIPLAVSNTLIIHGAQPKDAGTYWCVAYGPRGTSTSNSADLTVLSENEGDVGRLLNISTRSFVGIGDEIQIAGFIIEGNESKRILLRAAGPSLSRYNVPDLLADPVLRLFNTHGDQISENDNWEKATATSTPSVYWWFAEGSKDAALLVTLQPGAYTAKVSGKEDGTGIALVEAYELAPTGARLINISTRSLVRQGASIQIAGFVIGGNRPKTVLVRAAGPALNQFSISKPLADPILQLFDGAANQIAENDDWCKSTRDESPSVNWWFSENSRDSALIAVLPPGNYTAKISGKQSAEGVALVEVYELP